MSLLLLYDPDFTLVSKSIINNITYSPPPICRDSRLPLTKYEFSPLHLYTYKYNKYKTLEYST